MFAVSSSPIEQYRRVDTLTAVSQANPHGLIVLLFDGAIAAAMQARHAVAIHDLSTKISTVNKAMRIVDDGLKASLQNEGANHINDNLHALYDHIVRCLLDGNLRNRQEPLTEAIHLLAELRDAWIAIAPPTTRINRMQA